MEERELRDKFAEIVPALKAVGSHFVELLNRIIDEQAFKKGLVQIPATCRVKDVESFIVKACYGDRETPYTNPLEQIEDKVGTRIVFLSTQHAESIKDILLRDARIDCIESRSIEVERVKKPYEFEYGSYHLIADAPSKLGSDFGVEQSVLKCEIQLRSLAQHAWAEISHPIVYKGLYKNDALIKRILGRSSALLEVTDENFVRVFETMADKTRNESILESRLIDLYKSVRPEFDQADINESLAHSVFELYGLKPVSLEDLEVFVKTKKADLTTLSRENDELLFRQPLFLLMQYYLINHKNFLMKSWNMGSDAREKFWRGNGYSAGQF